MKLWSLLLLAGWFCLVESPLLADESELDNEPQVVRARLYLALSGVVIVGVVLLAWVRVAGWRVRRLLRSQRGPSRMSPGQWQARRWRETWQSQPPPEPPAVE